MENEQTNTTGNQQSLDGFEELKPIETPTGDQLIFWKPRAGKMILRGIVTRETWTTDKGDLPILQHETGYRVVCPGHSSLMGYYGQISPGDEILITCTMLGGLPGNAGRKTPYKYKVMIKRGAAPMPDDDLPF